MVKPVVITCGVTRLCFPLPEAQEVNGAFASIIIFLDLSFPHPTLNAITESKELSNQN